MTFYLREGAQGASAPYASSAANCSVTVTGRWSEGCHSFGMRLPLWTAAVSAWVNTSCTLWTSGEGMAVNGRRCARGMAGESLLSCLCTTQNPVERVGANYPIGVKIKHGCTVPMNKSCFKLDTFDSKGNSGLRFRVMWKQEHICYG